MINPRRLHPADAGRSRKAKRLVQRGRRGLWGAREGVEQGMVILHLRPWALRARDAQAHPWGAAERGRAYRAEVGAQ